MLTAWRFIQGCLKCELNLLETNSDKEDIFRVRGCKDSQLVSAALADFLARHGEDRITEKLNEVYRSEEPGPRDHAIFRPFP